MKLSERIKDEQINFKIASECVQLMENQVSAKKGITGVAFKTIYKGIKTISSDYTFRAISGLLPSVSEAIDPLWLEGIEKGDPVKHLTENQSMTADRILTVTDIKIEKAQNKIVKISYGKIRGSLQGEIEQVVPQLAQIIHTHIVS